MAQNIISANNPGRRYYDSVAGADIIEMSENHVAARAGEAITKGDPVCFRLAAGQWKAYRALAADSSKRPAQAVAIYDVILNSWSVFQTGGLTCFPFPAALTPSTAYYLADTGGITTTAPTFAQQIGEAMDTAYMFLRFVQGGSSPISTVEGFTLTEDVGLIFCNTLEFVRHEAS
jgi:hypothetical protein